MAHHGDACFEGVVVEVELRGVEVGVGVLIGWAEADEVEAGGDLL